MAYKHPTNALANFTVNVKVKLAFLWSSLMSLYIYADYFELMTPTKLKNMMSLKSPVGPTKPELLVVFSVVLIIPALLIVLSVFLKPTINKWMNIVFGILYALISVLIIASDIGNEWQAFFVLYNVVELFVLAAIVWQAWRWPRVESGDQNLQP